MPAYASRRVLKGKLYRGVKIFTIEPQGLRYFSARLLTEPIVLTTSLLKAAGATHQSTLDERLSLINDPSLIIRRRPLPIAINGKSP